MEITHPNPHPVQKHPPTPLILQPIHNISQPLHLHHAGTIITPTEQPRLTHIHPSNLQRLPLQLFQPLHKFIHIVLSPFYEYRTRIAWPGKAGQAGLGAPR
ncbi:hypothetical protein TWF694_004784 [Orbilia ellipsospora]|uniref:Uncharacterized protein n=1 Tax=Orbilia ellipsospora TaxID=2528407 RepID=A0AAV9X2A8_9PEZI